MKKKFVLLFAVITWMPFLSTAQEVEKADSLSVSDNTQEQNLTVSDETYNEEDDLEEINKKWNSRRKYKNLGFQFQTLSHQDIPGLEWKSQYAFSYNMGRTYYLHKKPLAGMMKFGIDWTYFDVTFAKYKDDQQYKEEEISSEGGYTQSDPDNPFSDIVEESTEDIDLGVMQIDAGMHVGPSFTINPVGNLMISTYFHFIPSVSFVFLNDEINYNFVPSWSYGGAIAWKAISLGVEYRWGKAKYKSLSIDEDAAESEDDLDFDNIEDIFQKGNNRLKTSYLRIYLSFRM